MMLIESEKERQLNHLLETRLNYRLPVKPFKRGGTSLLYETTWGPNDDVPVVVKVDNIPESSRAKRHVERGYDVGNELRQAAKIDHDGVVRIRDFFTPKETSQVGLDGWVIVQDKFVDSVDLEELVSQGSLSEEDFKEIMIQSASTVRDVYNQYGILHRDLKPSNIAVRRNEKIKIKILDYANAGKAEDMEEKVLATAGGKDVMPPWLLGNGRYDVRAEIYELCATGMFAARRKPVFDVDPEKGRIKDWDTGESIAENAIVDIEKYQKALEYTIKKLPKCLRRFRKVLSKGLSFRKEEGYNSFDDFVSDLEKAASQPTWKRRLGKVGLAVAGIAAVVTTVALYDNKTPVTKQQLEMEKNLAVVKLYEQRRSDILRQDYNDFIKEGRLAGYLNLFNDKMTAYSAFLSPQDTYAAIQAAGGKEDFASIKDYLFELNPTLWGDLFGIEVSAVDMLARQINRDEYKRVKKDWEETKKDYERKHPIDKATQRINPVSGLLDK